jgi:hypothetical protein
MATTEPTRVQENLLPPNLGEDNLLNRSRYQSTAQQGPVSERKFLCMKFVVFLLCIGVLIAGRFSVPDNDVPCIVDKVQEWLYGANAYILSDPPLRNALQIMCSGFMDILFLSTAGYWVITSRTSRLIFTILLFYITRALIQKIWFDPFPPNFWWYNPGFPSLVVPYGRGSDFFYSGHIGFVTICLCEWITNKKPWMIAFTLIGGFYTGFILLTYQVHYSIDIFTGMVYAHWCYLMMDRYKEKIDTFFVKVYLYLAQLFKGKSQKEVDML